MGGWGEGGMMASKGSSVKLDGVGGGYGWVVQ